jgi:hypothetical protein
MSTVDLHRRAVYVQLVIIVKPHLIVLIMQVLHVTMVHVSLVPMVYKMVMRRMLIVVVNVKHV